MNRRKMITLVGNTGVFGMIGFLKSSPVAAAFTKPAITVNKNNIITDKNKTMKTIGVLGGIGPQATMNFETMLHDAARKIIPPLHNSGYPPMVVYYHRYAPVLIKEDLTPVLPIQPDSRLLEAAKNLGMMADFLVITSNGVHGMQQEIEAAAGKKVLSMIDITLAEINNRQWKKVGVVGYRNAMVYTSRLKEMGIAFELVPAELQQQLDNTVMKVMEGGATDADRILITGIVTMLREKNVDGIVLGCTELPLLLDEKFDAADILNPAKLLAAAAVQHALL